MQNVRKFCFKKSRKLIFFVSFFCLYLCVGCANFNSDFVIAIDIGHSTNSPGALSARGVPEYEFNKNLALKLLKKLHSSAYSKAFLIDEDGMPRGNTGLKNRTAIAKKNNANLFISIHHDSVKKQFLKQWSFDGRNFFYCDEFNGYSIIVSTNNTNSENSIKFAKYLGDEFLNRKMTPTMYHTMDIDGERRRLIDKKRGIYDINFWVVDKAEMPSVLIETGMIINRNEEKRLANHQYQTKIIKSIINAIQKYIKQYSSEQNQSE